MLQQQQQLRKPVERSLQRESFVLPKGQDADLSFTIVMTV